MANPNPSPSSQFKKGHPKIGNAGRKPGPNPFQKLLNEAVLEAAEQVGEVKVVEGDLARPCAGVPTRKGELNAD